MPEQSLKEKTAKGLFWGAVNNGAQQLLVLVFGIILGRMLGPAEYGMVGMLTVFTLIGNRVCLPRIVLLRPADSPFLS